MRKSLQSFESDSRSRGYRNRLSPHTTATALTSDIAINAAQECGLMLPGPVCPTSTEQHLVRCSTGRHHVTSSGQAKRHCVSISAPPRASLSPPPAA
jgi:hypothetical protein